MDKVYVMKDGIKKQIYKSELTSYIMLGWVEVGKYNDIPLFNNSKIK